MCFESTKKTAAAFESACWIFVGAGLVRSQFEKKEIKRSKIVFVDFNDAKVKINLMDCQTDVNRSIFLPERSCLIESFDSEMKSPN